MSDKGPHDDGGDGHRPHHHHHHHRKPPWYGGGDNGSSPEMPRFRNVKPRVGSQYQTKVPKLIAAGAGGRSSAAPLSSRPSPLKMSNEVPHLTQNQFDMNTDESLSNNTTAVRTTTTARFPAPSRSEGGTASIGYGPVRITMPPTSRGGLLVHRPDGTATSDFVHSLHSSLPTTTTVRTWVQTILLEHHNGGGNNNNAGGGSGGGGGRDASTSSRSRRSRKRKYASSSPSMMDETTTTSSSPSPSSSAITTSKQQHDAAAHRPLSVGDETQLEFLTLRHDGNVNNAQLSLLVASGGGRAYRARRELKRQDHIDRFKRPSITSSASWKERLERECCFPGGILRVSSIIQEVDMKCVWKVVLALAQEINKTLTNSASTSASKPLLSHVIALLKNAYCLPLPEESYGTRHVVVEGISESMHNILDHVTKAHDVQAKLLDVLFDERGLGVDIATVLKVVEECDSALSIRLDIVNILEEQMTLAQNWQSRLDGLTRDGLVVDSVNDLAMAEELLREAGTFAICWQGQVELKESVQKAYQLRDRLREWQTSCLERKKQSFKFVAALVRDANRLNMNFPEVSELLMFHQEAESWIERANVALRSRISLTEIESLLDRAEKMPLDLSEYTKKLQNRISLSQSWISEFQDLVPAPFVDGKVDNLAWMSRMRQALQTTEKGFLMQLHDIATEGTRIPVEIDCVKLLLVEIDAKTWSLKAVKWIPSRNVASEDGDGTNGRKPAKLIDIRDHLNKAETIRESLILPPEEKEAWKLEGESELKSIVEAADDWYDKYHEYLEYDNRRNRGDRSCLSIATLRQIVNQGNLIHAQIGSATGKMSRILGQAETWYAEYENLLFRCSIPASVAPSLRASDLSHGATLDEIKAAVESAEANISLDLDEARALRDLSERIEKWQDRVAMAAPKRSKRAGKRRHKEARFTVDDLVALIDESTSLPIKTDEDVERLHQQLCSVREWRVKARREFVDIASKLRSLRQAVNSDYGLPDELRDENHQEDERMDACENAENLNRESSDVVEQPNQDSCSAAFSGDTRDETHAVNESDSDMQIDRSTGDGDAQESAEDSSQADASSVADSDLGTTACTAVGGGAVFKMISSLLKSLKLSGIRTSEEEVADLLEKSARWIIRSLKCIESPKDVYERKSFGPFDEFIEDGEALLVSRDDLQTLTMEDAGFLPTLSSALGDLVSDQIIRLKIIQAHRDQYISWYKNVQEVFSSKENRATLEVLRELAEQSHEYPASSDMVQKVRQVAHRAANWKAAACKLFDSDEKPTIQEARAMLDQGDKLNLACDELTSLRSAVRSAQSWATRVKRSKIDQGKANSTTVTKLLDEHESLLLSMPNEYAKLNQTLRGYCLCRQPYDGFMIACNGCDEWYHGPCVGITEARAGKTDKFVCLRCCLKRTLTSSALTVASVIRKWTDPDELRKARQQEAQKHQRKVRKEKRDIQNLTAEAECLAAMLRASDGARQSPVSQGDGQGIKVEAAALPPSSSEVESPLEAATANGERTGKGSDEASATAEYSSCSGINSSGDLVPSAAPSPQECDNFVPKSKQEIEVELGKAAEALRASGDRLAALNAIAKERKIQEGREDEKQLELRRWCIRLRSLVLVPSTMERAASSLPPSDGCLAAPMVQVLKDATSLNIHEFSVVADVENAFRCIAWSCFALPLVARRPSLHEIDSIIAKGTHLNLPEEKPMRMMKSIAQRARTWQTKVVKALAPRPHVTDPVNIKTLKGLVEAAASIPLSIPGEACVQNVVDDKGTRYCICGGPHFGSFMLGCDRCERWYHGRCVGVDSKEGEALSNWVCPPCNGVSDIDAHLFSVDDLDYSEGETGDDMSDSEDDIAIHAPLPEQLWPPFGLLKSPEAVKALGEKCCAVEDDVSDIGMKSFSHFSNRTPTVGSGVVETTNGMNPLKSHGIGLFNPYTFGGSAGGVLSNGKEPVKPVFTDAAAGHASSLMSPGASSTNAYSFSGLISCDLSQDGISGAHGFHGVATTETVENGGSDANSFRETASFQRGHLSSTDGSAGNLLNGSSASSHENDTHSSKALSSMNWQPAIMQAASSDSAGVANDSTLQQAEFASPGSRSHFDEQKIASTDANDSTSRSTDMPQAVDQVSAFQQHCDTSVQETERGPTTKMPLGDEQPLESLAQKIKHDSSVQMTSIAQNVHVAESPDQVKEQPSPEVPRVEQDALRFELRCAIQETAEQRSAPYMSRSQEGLPFDLSSQEIEKAQMANLPVAQEGPFLDVPIQDDSLDVRAS